MTRRHLFIVFEGLDGAGTTTQSKRLHHSFTSNGAPSFATFEPTAGPVGEFIRSILTGAQHDADNGTLRPSENAMALLFAADRLAHSDVITRQQRAGHVVCDRYIFSSMAYQSLDDSISPERVIELNRGCAIPDLTVFLSVPADVCLARITGRGEGETIYEKREHLLKIAENYDRLLPLYRKHFGDTVTIDGTMSPDAVHAAVMDEMENRGVGTR